MSKRRLIPPKLAQRIINRMLRDDLAEEVLGDLEEKFYKTADEKTLLKAKLNYWFQVLNYLRPFAIKKSRSEHANMYDMYRNYFKIGYRNITRHKAFSTINIAGLAMGMTCFLMIFLWVNDEKNIDDFHSKGDNLYSVYENIQSQGQVKSDYSTPMWHDGEKYNIPFEDLGMIIPEIKTTTFYVTGYELPWGYPKTFRHGEQMHKLEGSRASKDFFNTYDYPLIVGDSETALSGLSSIAISKKMAQLFFDSPEAAIGKSLRYENKFDLIVTAVFEDVTAHSTLQFEFLINWESHMTRMEWSGAPTLTTFQLTQNAEVEEVEKKINDFLQTRLPKEVSDITEVGLQPFRDRYLVSGFANGKPSGGRVVYVRIFSLVAIFMLLVACINFMNLSTARSIKRAKEVAVRKVVGSTKGYLIGQFLSESILLSLVSSLISLVLVWVFLPLFNEFTGKQILLPIDDFQFWFYLGGLVLITGFVAGSYPALFLSSLKPLTSLKGLMRFSTGTVWFRKGLVVFQFSISILLLIATIVISRQTDYVQSTQLGYDRENLISVRVEGNLNEKYAVFKEQLSSMPGIAMVDRSSEAPHAMGFEVADAINWQGKEKGSSIGFKPASVGFDFVKMMNFNVVQGREFSREYASDAAGFMINEVALKQMGMVDPIGKWISAWEKRGPIIGVLKDYHTHSLHEQIKPIILDVKEDLYFGVVLVKSMPGQTSMALASLEKVYEEINPNIPLEYAFLDVEYDKLYKNELVMAKLSNVFAVLAIVISCLGLLGLAMFSAEQRTKEIGIRKVLGASVTNIFVLFSKDFVRLVGISFLITVPIAWYVISDWLQRFAYHIQLSWWIFALAGMSALLVAITTVGVQSIKTAVSNPVDSLRSE